MCGSVVALRQSKVDFSFVFFLSFVSPNEHAQRGGAEIDGVATAIYQLKLGYVRLYVPENYKKSKTPRALAHAPADPGQDKKSSSFEEGTTGGKPNEGVI